MTTMQRLRDVQLPPSVLGDAGLTIEAKALYADLMLRMRDRDIYSPSVKTLALRFNVPNQTIKDSLRQLAKAGHIELIQQPQYRSIRLVTRRVGVTS